MNRRHFLSALSATVAGAKLGFTQVQTAALTIGAGTHGPTIPHDFLGLSFESAQLANQHFFSSANRRLVELFRGLSPSGNLRIGGSSSEFTTYSEAVPISPAPFDVFSPATGKTIKKETVTSALALRNLRSFLDATNWSCLYGLNLGQGTKENAATEAASVQRLLGPRLLAFQIGNEPDSFRNRFRPSSYGPEDFIREWKVFHEAITAAAPGAKFAGPDISNKFNYLTAFAAEAPNHPDVILLTGHFYAMGPAGSPDATLGQLFEPDPRSATMHPSQIELIQDARNSSGLPYRISEGNSCWDGGKPGVSDTLAGALWCAGMMLRFAQRGWAGVNLHGGGQSFYTPIAGTTSNELTPRPEYFGMQFAQLCTGSTFLPATLTSAAPHITAYALEKKGRRRVAIINPYDTSSLLTLPSIPKGTASLLTGPSLAAKDGTTLATIRAPHRATVTLLPHSATLYDL